MNQKIEMTQIANSAGEYLAPKVKVTEIKVRKMLCASPTGDTQQYGYQNADWGENL